MSSIHSSPNIPENLLCSEILKKLNSGILIGFDKDIEAISASSKRLEKIAKVLKF